MVGTGFYYVSGIAWIQWRRYLWGIGARAPLEFWKCCAFCSFCQLNCKGFENYQRKTCIIFLSISPVTRKNRLKQSPNYRKIPGRGGEKKFLSCPLTSFPGDATARMLCI